MTMELTAPNTSAARVLELKATIKSTLERELPPFGEFALLDYPDHPNVGDSAIWLGETRYFSEVHHRHPSLVSTLHRHPLQEILAGLPDGPIFLHGGGNFGDIYPYYQEWREDLLRHTAGRLVVQLPQSIHFSSADRLKSAARAIAAHGNFLLLVRDAESYRIAEENFDCRVVLCPDMAFFLGPLRRPERRSVDVLCLLRTDDERAAEQFSGGQTGRGELSTEVCDWLEEDDADSSRLLKPNKMDRILAARWGALPRSNYRGFGFHRLASARLRRGLKLLSRGDWVITDRLHAHILSLLLGIDHVALDNSYGKVRRFIEAWTSGIPGVHTSQTLPGALEVVAEGKYKEIHQ
ncbi:MAG: polysaccharide pyruvyl transferase family protein [Devosia sp.]|nr:polysaccharide pyruvyl transferase family protein [Devosia sp.]